MHPALKIGLVLFALPFLALCLFAHPVADDYCHSAVAVDKGFRGAITFWYTQWQGRFFSTALVTFYPIAFDFFATFKVIALLILVGLFAGIYGFTRAMLRDRMQGKEIFWIAFLVFVLYLSSMPSVFEGVYWASASLTYQTGLIFTLLLFSLLLSYEPSSRGPAKFLRIVAICLLTVAAAGCSETSLVVALAGLAAGSLMTLKWRRDACQVWIAVLLVCIAAAAVVMLAPGNEIRAQNFPLRFRLGISLLKTAVFSVYVLLKSWPSLPALAAATVIVAAMASRATRNRAVTPNQFVLSLLLWAGLFAVSFFPAFYGTGGRPGPRSIDVSCALFLIGWFVNIFFLAGFAGRTLRREPSIPPKLLKIAQIVLIVSLFTLGNFPGVAKDLVSAAVTYDRELAARYAMIRTASRSRTADVEVPHLSVIPQSLVNPDSELHEDPDHWINKCWAKYFGVKSIRRTAM